MFCAITLKHYAYYNFSEEARSSTTNFLNAAAYIAELFIYMYLGIAFFVVDLEWNWPFIGLSVLFCLVGRLFVYPMCMLANIKRKKKIPFNFQVFLWFSGLRGAIAFALVLLLPDIPHKNMVVTTTLIIVVLTTFSMGGLAVPILRALKIKLNDSDEDDPPTNDPKGNINNGEIVTDQFHSVDKKLFLPFLSNKKIKSLVINNGSSMSSMSTSQSYGSMLSPDSSKA